MIRWLAFFAAMSALLASSAHAFDPARLGRMVEATNFAGVLLVSRGDTVIYARAFGEVRPGGGELHRLDARWRWASITKQLVATIAMQEVQARRMELDAPIARYWPDFPNESREAITIRHLMQHLSGLPNPDDTPLTRIGLPAFYTGDGAEIARADGYCAGPLRTEPGATYAYSNCNFIVLGAILERVTGEPLGDLVAERIPGSMQFYPSGEPAIPGFHNGQSEPPIRFEAYGAAGGLNGTIFDLWHFDRALMTGALLTSEARAQMWDGDPALGYAALGQWVFPAPLTGCAEPQRLVERRGAIGGVQGRNFILPDLDMAVIAFVNRSEAEFDFGDIWSGEGFAHDILAEAACHRGEA